jgi:hypothetical protein
MEEKTYPPEIQRIADRIPERWGRWISCESGWWPLLIELNEKLEQIAPNYTIHQVKEKFGTLRFYFEVYDDEADKYQEMSKIIDDYEAMSAHICEKCGAEGAMKVRNDGYWCKTMCATCAETNGYVPWKRWEA